MTFTVSPLAAPVITAPAGTVPSPVTVAWQAVPGATSYRVVVSSFRPGMSQGPQS